MAGLIQRRPASAGLSTNETNTKSGNNNNIVEQDSHTITNGVSQKLSGVSATTNEKNDITDVNGSHSTVVTNGITNSNSKSLKERSEIPNSILLAFGFIISTQYFSGMYQWKTIDSYYQSVTMSCIAIIEMVSYLKNLVWYCIDKTNADNPLYGNDISMTDYIRVGVLTVFMMLMMYVFFVAPFIAGFWTGRRSKKHIIHRYLGLFYLVSYVFTWVEFFTNYDPFRASYLCHLITCNGIIQATSAYFSFKVLPELIDPGYYSDKAVLSRTFIHENIYFTFLAVIGSLYFIKDSREALRTNVGGRVLEHIFIFWPYILIRPWFPITSFSNTGITYKGRSDPNKRFYEIGTTMVKFFYLWAKYFFGFFINFSVFLGLVTEEDWRLLHGMLILNAGTVSLSVFLHTLRFKKVLPAKFTFTFYLVQIYLSFLALPTAFKMFASHPNLSALCIAGLLLNFTRSRKLHALWCLASAILLTQTDIVW